MWFLCDNETEQEIIESDEYPKMIGEGGRWSSLHPFKTKEDLELKVLEKPCILCGKWIYIGYVEERKQRLIAKNMCFSCDLWDERSGSIKNDVNVMITPEGMYSCREDFEGPGFRGFGGDKFTFQVIKTGEIKQSSNVWYGGKIPKHFKDKIPNNAIMLHGYEPTKTV